MFGETITIENIQELIDSAEKTFNTAKEGFEKRITDYGYTDAFIWASGTVLQAEARLRLLSILKLIADHLSETPTNSDSVKRDRNADFRRKARKELMREAKVWQSGNSTSPTSNFAERCKQVAAWELLEAVDGR